MNQEQPVNQEQPAPPSPGLKPWYYQDWFLLPMIVFWPLWPILILRSPWHNGLLSGAVAWAMLFVMSFLIVWEQLVKTGGLNDITIIILIPGLLFTVITQVHWFGYRKTLKDAGTPAASPSNAADPVRPPRVRARRRRKQRR